MTTYSWKSGTNGDWSVAGNWTPAGQPNDYSAIAVIAAPGSYTVTVGANDYWTVGGLVLADPSASLDIAGIVGGDASTFENRGIITIDGTYAAFAVAVAGVANLGSIVLSAGRLFLNGKIHTSALAGLKTHDGSFVSTTQLINTGATLSIGLGGAIAGFNGYVDGGVIQEAAAPTSDEDVFYGELNNVSVHGTLFAGGVVTIVNGTTFAGYTGSGIGGFRIDGGGNFQAVDVEGSTTLDNADLTVNSATLLNDDVARNGQTLTLGANLVCTVSYGTIDAGDLTGDRMVNLGTIVAISANVVGTSFTNAGTITIGRGDGLNINTATFDNTGTVIVDGGNLSLSQTVSTLAGVALQGGTLSLLGTIDSLAELSWTSGSTLNIRGELVNTGSTLSAPAFASAGLQLYCIGTISGGVVVDPDGLLQPSELDDVTYRGSLVAPIYRVTFRDGFDLGRRAGNRAGLRASHPRHRDRRFEHNRPRHPSDWLSAHLF